MLFDILWKKIFDTLPSIIKKDVNRDSHIASSPISQSSFFEGSFSCKRGFSLLNFERGLKKTMGCLILKLYVVIILY